MKNKNLIITILAIVAIAAVSYIIYQKNSGETIRFQTPAGTINATVSS